MNIVELHYLDTIHTAPIGSGMYLSPGDNEEDEDSDEGKMESDDESNIYVYVYFYTLIYEY